MLRCLLHAIKSFNPSMTSQKYDYTAIDVGYYDKVYSKSSGVQSRWHQYKFESVRKRLPNSGRHLDIGCGPGTLIGSIKNQAIHSVGIDISSDQISYANAKYGSPNSQFKVSSASDLKRNLGDCLFDVITIIEVLEHLPEDEAFRLLCDAKSLLRPGKGKLLVTTPNYSSLWPLIEYLVNRIGEVRYEDQHINRYKPIKLSNQLRFSGFQVKSINSFMSFSPFLASFSWRLSKFISSGDIYGGSMINLGMLLIAEANLADATE